MYQTKRMLAALTIATLLGTAGCSPYRTNDRLPPNGPTAMADKAKGPNTVAQSAHVVGSSYNPHTKTVDITVSLYGEPGRRLAHMTTPTQSHWGEQVLDLANRPGVMNYAFAQYPSQTIRTVVVSRVGPKSSRLARLTIDVPKGLQTPTPLHISGTTGDASTASSHVAGGAIQIPPPGCHIDKELEATARGTDPLSEKTQAVLATAQTELGTPYLWGHTEDSGQIGFDSGQFTAFVYHHALGYQMSTSGRGQYNTVGVPVPKGREKYPGDLLIFDQGRQVGIYMGKNRAIGAGFGQNRVTYTPISPSSYWGRHLTAVRRMY